MIHKVDGKLADARGIPFEIGQTVIHTPSGERQIVLKAEIVDLGKNNVLLGNIHNLVGREAGYRQETIRTTSSTLVIVDKLPPIQVRP